MKKFGVIIFCVALFLASRGTSPAGDAIPHEFIVGIFPRDSATASLAAFSPLAEHLSRRLGRKVQLALSKDFPSFVASLRSGRFDIVHLNHLQYIQTGVTAGYTAFLQNKESGSSGLRAALFVRKDSPCQNISDLKGKTILFGGDKTAFISYAGGTRLLREAGLSAADYREEFAISPPNALIALARGAADAAATGDVSVHRPMVKNAGADAAVRILAVSQPYPGLPWAIKSTLPADVRQKIKKAFLELNETPEGARIRSTAGIDGFDEADHAGYAAVSETMTAIAPQIHE